MREYINELNKSKVRVKLTKIEEYDLAVKASQGDIQARNTLVEKVLPFAIQQARKMVTYSMSIGELTSAANEGLIKAADRFDPKTGVRFITYAVHYIKCAILEELNGRHLIRVPYKTPVLWTSSIDEPVLGTDNLLVVDTLESNTPFADEFCIRKDNKNRLHTLLNGYDQRTRDVLDAYYNIYSEYSTIEKVCEKYNITSERVRNIKKDVMKKLKIELC